MLWKWLLYSVTLNFLTVFSQDAATGSSTDGFMPCDENWFHFGEKCYLLQEEERSWIDAAYRCNVLGGELVSIHSQEELDFLVVYILDAFRKELWIGFNDRVNEGEFAWHDRSPVNFTNWMTGEPTNKDSDEEDCAAMFFVHFRKHRDIIGQWNDAPCNERHSFICQKKTDPEKRTPDHRYCSSDEGGGWKFRESCYHVLTEQHTLDKAEDYCKKNYNGHLVTVLDFMINWFLDSVLTSLQDKHIWIGIKIREQFQQKWTSGWHVSFDAGLSKRHQEFKEGLCVLRTQREEWKLVSCSETHSFVCEVSKTVPPVLKPAVRGSHCPTEFPEWRDLDGEYCYHFETEKIMSWFESRFECESIGGHLVSIHSQEENDILHPFIKYTQRGIYIGLIRSTEDKLVFQWIDGSPVNFLKWDVEQPDYDKKIEECGEVFVTKMEWNDCFCDLAKGYICSVKKTLPFSKSDTNRTVLEILQSDGDRSCNEGWYYFQEKCYTLGGKNDSKTWNEAADSCSSDGGYLVTIQSKEELDFVVSSILLDIQSDVWIGLQNPGNQSNFSWHDGSPLKYVNWMLYDISGKDVPGDEGCIKMVFSHPRRDSNVIGEWKDELCAIKLPYICQSKTNTLPEDPMNLGAVIGTAVFFILATSLLGIGIYCFRARRKQHSIKKEDDHSYETVDYKHPSFQKNVGNPQGILEKTVTPSSNLSETQHSYEPIDYQHLCFQQNVGNLQDISEMTGFTPSRNLPDDVHSYEHIDYQHPYFQQNIGNPKGCSETTVSTPRSNFPEA